MNAQILCAGLGERFLPITKKTPKPAIPFLNVPLMAYSLYYFEQLGLDRLVINTHHLPEKVQGVTECLTHDTKYSLAYPHEEKILGSGGGIKNAESHLIGKKTFALANGDEVFFLNHDRGLQPMLDFHNRHDALATILTTEHADAGKTLGGVWFDSQQKIQRIGDTDGSAQAKHYAGVILFSDRIFEMMPKGQFHIFKDCLVPAIKRGEKVLAHHESDMVWLDMTNEKHYIQSTAAALKLLNSESAATGLLTKILKRFGQNFTRLGETSWGCPGSKFDGKLKPNSYLFMGPKSYVSMNVEIQGFGVIGPSARLNEGLLENSVVGADLHLNEVHALRNELLLG